MATTTRLQLYDTLSSLYQQKYNIEKQISQIQNQLNQINISENKQYIGKCFKQIIEDDVEFKTIYYKILYINEENPYSFWTLVVEDPFEELEHIPTNYIYKQDINFLGQNKFFLRQLTPISDKEFIETIDNVYDHLIDMSNKIPNKEIKHFELKCPNCDSIGPLVDLYPNITDIEYTCENCGCKYIAKFQHGECVSIEEE